MHNREIKKEKYFVSYFYTFTTSGLRSFLVASRAALKCWPGRKSLKPSRCITSLTSSGISFPSASPPYFILVFPRKVKAMKLV